ncbi:MAG TPA: branched-chain amino acid ABC transporter permease, partial [Tepidisphaeraceae bacterium]
LGCTLLGFAIEFFAYRPLRSRPRLVALITAIGVSFLLENLGILIYGPTPHAMPALFVIRPIISFHVARNSEPVSISNLDVLSLALMVALMIVLTWMVLKTKTGLALRAVSHRFDTAALMGINPNRTISFTFMFGSALAAIAGVLNGIRYNVEPLMGVMPGIKAFVAAVLGGIGNIPGAVIGGLLMGLIETMLKGWILPSGYTGYADAAAFLVLILILLIKPSGLLGRHVPEKV